VSIDFAALVADLAAEQDDLDRVLAQLAPEHWELPTHAPGWAVRDQVAHLAFFDDQARLAIEDPAAFETVREAANAGGPAFEQEYLARGRAMTPTGLYQWWRESSRRLTEAAGRLTGSERLPWFGPSMGAASFVTARLMETWSHGLDVVDVVPFERPDTERLRHVAELGVRTRAYSYAVRGRTPPEAPVRVELVSPGGARWVFGPAEATDVIRGSATDFCRVVTQRRHLADTDLEVSGPAALEWMEIAQAFAGPPGPGRKPGEFRKEG